MPFLRGQRVLIVEDEWLLAVELQALLEQQGCIVLGPVNTVARALTLLDRERPDFALLDLNLNGQQSTPVASVLLTQRVPFVVVTGYGEAASRKPDMQAAPYIGKPVDHQALVRLLSQML